MLVDLHLHEKTCSTDSFLSLEDIVSASQTAGPGWRLHHRPRQHGRPGLCRGLCPPAPAPHFRGGGVFSLQGDITAWGIDTFPDHRIDAQDLIDQVNRSGGFCVSCHPFRNNNRGLGGKSAPGPWTPRGRGSQRQHHAGGQPHRAALLPGTGTPGHRGQRRPCAPPGRQVCHLAPRACDFSIRLRGPAAHLHHPSGHLERPLL